MVKRNDKHLEVPAQDMKFDSITFELEKAIKRSDVKNVTSLKFSGNSFGPEACKELVAEVL